MEVVLNDYSLSGQFDSVSDFTESLTSDILPTLNTLVTLKLEVLKSHTTYSRKVTRNETLYDVLKLSRVPEITALKSKLVQSLSGEPYWNENAKTLSDAEYICPYTKQIPNCFTETVERNGILISFFHESFLEEFLHISKNNVNLIIMNSINNNSMLGHLYGSNVINQAFFFTNIKIEIQVEFCKFDNREYAQEAFLNNNLNNDDFINVKNDILQMIEYVIDNKPSRFSEKLSDSLAVFRTSVSDGREFRLFYIHKDRKIVFLNGYIKKTEKIPEQEKKLATKLKNAYRWI